MRCQNCKTEITNKQVDLETMVASCPQCNAKSRLWVLPEKPAKDAPAPERVVFSERPSQTQIIYRPRKDFGTALVALFFCSLPVSVILLHILALDEKVVTLIITVPFVLFFGFIAVLLVEASVINLLSKVTIEDRPVTQEAV